MLAVDIAGCFNGGRSISAITKPDVATWAGAVLVFSTASCPFEALNFVLAVLSAAVAIVRIYCSISRESGGIIPAAVRK